jgi:hypothetical protein
MISKNSLIILFVLIGLCGCTPQNPQPNPPANNVVAVSWQATINGVSNSYSDTYTNLEPTNAQGNNEGECLYFLPTISLRKGGPFTAGDDVNISIQRNEIFSVGTYVITTTTGGGGGAFGLGMSASVNGILGHSSYPNTNVTLNITEVSATAGGLIKGNFSGVLGVSPQAGGGTIPVSGQFQAIRGI